MSPPSRLVKNAGILMGMELGGKLFGLAGSIMLARYLAPERFGLLSFAVSFVALFKVVSGFGMGSLIVRDLARNPKEMKRYLSHGLTLKTAFSLLGMMGIGLALWGLRYPWERGHVVLLTGVVMCLDAILRFTGSFFQAVQQMGWVAGINLACDLGWLAVAVGVVLAGRGLTELLVFRILVTGGMLLISVGLIHRRLCRISWDWDWRFGKGVLGGAVPFALSTLFLSIYSDIDVVMLSFLRGDLLTGWYAVARRFQNAFSFIPLSVRAAALPALSELSQQSHEAVREHLARTCRFLAMASLPIVGGIFVLSDPLVAALFGPAYQGAVPALRVLIGSVFLMFLNHGFWAALSALGREKQTMLYMGAGALLNILGNLVAIPWFGHVGASATTVLSFAVVFAMELRLVSRLLPGFDLWREIRGSVMAAGLMMGLTWWLHRHLPLAFTIPLAALGYGAALLFWGPSGKRGVRGWKLEELLS